MKKHQIALLTMAIALTIMTPVSALADTLTVSGLDIVNNTDKGSDYKLTQQQVSNLNSSFNSGSQYNEVFSQDNGRYEENLSQDYSYLINHNIISRGDKIVANSKGVQVVQPSETAMPTGNENATNFLMGLYKSLYGTINSRELVFQYPSAREINGKVQILGDNSKVLPNGYKGSDTEFNYKGDDYVYVSPNVPELYLSKLLSMGVISTSDIKDQTFLNEYQANGTTTNGIVSQQEWSNNANAYYPLADSSTVQQALGSSWQCSVSDGTFTATRGTPDYMVQSNITTIQALEYIAKMMQVKTNALSPEEEKIIDYDYGASYLLTLPEPLKSTLSYLVAMGVISFQTPYDYSQLYMPLTKQYATQLLYRVANPAGRVNFKKLQLTATQQTLMQDGFVKQNIQVDSVSNPVAEPKTVSVQQTAGYYNSTGGTGGGDTTTTSGTSTNTQSLFSKVASALGIQTKGKTTNYEANSSGTTQFTVVKEFLNPTQAMYMGTQVNQISTGCSGVSGTQWVDNKTALEVTFKINAPNAATALAVINSRITLSNNANITSEIQTVTKITGNNTTVSYISQADLLSELSDLEVVNDKTLRNKQTGAMAEYLTNDDMALIGNTVVHSPDPMVEMIDGQVYYNMAMVLPLLGNAYISNLDPGKMIVSGTLSKVNLTPVVESGNTIQYDPTTTLSDLAQGSVVSNGTMFDENQLTHGISTLIRNYMIQNPSGGTPYQATVIVDWAYSMPNSEEFADLQDVDSNPFNPINASNFLYTAPSNQTLLSWWNSNIGISNALANMMYGTSGGNYIRTGYLAPSVTVLCNSSNPAMENVILNSIFGTMQFSSYYINNYMGGKKDSWKDSLFNQYGNGAGSRREFHYIGSKETSSLGSMYNNQYFVTTTGKVFKKISTDPRLSYNNGTITVNGRTQPSTEIPNVGSVVYMNKQYYYVKDLQDIGGSQYMALAALTPVSTSVDGQMSDTNTGDMYNQLYGAITNDTKPLKDGYIAAGDYGKFKLANSYLVPAQYMKNPSAIYYANGEIKGVTTDSKSTSITGNYKGSKYGGTLYGNPVIYLSTEDYSILNGDVTTNKVSPYLEMGNIFYSGLNNSVITSILGNSEGATSVSKLPTGAKVIIADTIYQKTANGLESYPIQNGTLVSGVAADPSNASTVQNAVESLYTSTALFMSGRSVPFAQYIKSATVGDLPKGIDASLVNGTLFAEGSNLKYGNGTSISSYNGSTPKSVCINLQLQSGVNFVCIDKSSNLYQLETITNIMGSNGQVGGNLFKNQLFFLNGNNLFTQYVKALYAPLPNWRTIMKDYTISYQNQWWVNLANSIKLLSVYVFILYFFLVLFSYIVVEYGVGRFFFESIHLRQGKDGGSGPDIPSMITMGMCSLDDESPSPARIFIVMLLLFMAQYLIATYL